jgi:ASCH domain
MPAAGASDEGPADEARADDDRERIALAIQQPWAELILRGIKTLEIRSQPTRQRGTILLYASKRVSALPAAQAAARRVDLDVESLPRGKVVGSVDLIDCRHARSNDQQAACVGAELLRGQFAYEVAHPQRFATPRTPRFLPYGVWFYPFKRRPKRNR